MAKPAPQEVIRHDLPCVSEHELIALISNGWKVVRNAQGWNIVTVQKHTGLKMVVRCSEWIIETALQRWPKMLRRHFIHLEYVP